MDFGQAYVLVLTHDNMIVQLFQHNKLESAPPSHCQARQSSSPLPLQLTRFQSIVFNRLILCSFKLQCGTWNWTSPMLGWSVLASTFCSGQHAVGANQSVPTGFQSPSFVAPRLCRWRKAVLRSHGSVFSSAETPPLLCFHYTQVPRWRKTPTEQRAQGQRSGITVVIYFLFVLHTGDSLTLKEQTLERFLFWHNFLFFVQIILVHHKGFSQTSKEETICAFFCIFLNLKHLERGVPRMILPS